MAHYKLLYDSDYLYAFHLQGKKHVVKIAKVTGGELVGEGGRKSRKPLVFFEGKEKPLALNKTNGKCVAALYGPDTEKWVGQYITIYPTTTQFGGEQRECVRIEPQKPEPPGKGAAREPGAEG